MQGIPAPSEPGKEKDPFGLGTAMGDIMPNSSPSFMPGGPAVQAAPTPGGVPVQDIRHQDIRNAIAAQAAGGSIMDRQKPDWYKNLTNRLGPTAGTAAQTGLDLLDTALGGISPLDAAGGGSKAIAVQGGKFFHGTPKVFQEFDKALSKSEGLVGPGVAYLTSHPQVAESYAYGATHGFGVKSPLEAKMYLNSSDVMPGYQPNIRPYQVQPHNSLVTTAPVPKTEYDAILKSLREHTLEQGQLPGRLTAEQRANNQVANMRANVKPGDTGAEVWKALSNATGPEKANAVLQKSGFQSIQYPGGVIMGDIKHTALNVLDPSIMKSSFDPELARQIMKKRMK